LEFLKQKQQQSALFKPQRLVYLVALVVLL
jgi:hypothetical protein